MGVAVHIYHKLPRVGRSVAARLRGLHPRSWRDGRERERLIELAREREHWTSDQWRSWREERLGRMLERAATRVPYYREQWARRRRRGDRASWTYLENWPILERDAVRECPSVFVADDRRGRLIPEELTSGSNDEPLEIWRSRDTASAFHALSTLRTQRWHGLSGGDHYAMLGGPTVTSPRRRRRPLWVWNGALGQLYMSAHKLVPTLVPAYLGAIVRHRIKYLFGNASAVQLLASEALRLGRSDVALRAVITNAAPLDTEQRWLIGEAFQCSVRETYVMPGVAAAASECPWGVLHEWPEVGVLEVLQGTRTAEAGTLGEMICTKLLNPDMPLVRYRTGDCGRVNTVERLCACGRTLPIFARLEGRSSDMLITRDGRRLCWLGPVFHGLPIRHSQIIQVALDHIRIRYVPAPNFTPAAGQVIVERLRARVGTGVNIVLEEIAEVPPAPDGRFRSIVCVIPEAERRVALSEGA